MSEQTDKINDSRDEMLDRVQTAGAVSIPPHIFEQLYLGPKNNVHGKLRQTFGNPTPVGKTAFSTWVRPGLTCSDSPGRVPPLHDASLYGASRVAGFWWLRSRR